MDQEKIPQELRDFFFYQPNDQYTPALSSITIVEFILFL
jgi:hypothetical protein